MTTFVVSAAKSHAPATAAGHFSQLKVSTGIRYTHLCATLRPPRTFLAHAVRRMLLLS